MDYDIYEINISNFSEIIAMWHTAYNYDGPTVCAKDQTKVAELIEISTMTMEELHNKISSFKKATYITVYALSACIPGIPPVVIALYFAGAMTIGLYFDRAALDQNWLDESTLILNAFENFPINLHFMDNSLPFICGTDIYHCIKKGRNMHISGTRVCSIGHYIMSPEHLWILKENLEIYSSLTNDILNPKDKQSDKFA
ncbi:18681_t:CDS:2, partial [Gigaspora rosea]